MRPAQRILRACWLGTSASRSFSSALRLTPVRETLILDPNPQKGGLS